VENHHPASEVFNQEKMLRDMANASKLCLRYLAVSDVILLEGLDIYNSQHAAAGQAKVLR
jgi:hypothetical protein